MKRKSVPTGTFCVLSFAYAGLLVGCANPGPPRPPTLSLPALVNNLTAERVGERVLLSWTTPSTTTDEMNVKSSLIAEICRSSTPSAANSKKSFAKCSVVKRVPTAPGPSSVWDDLPQSLLTDPVTPLAYQVEIFNGAGRSAGRCKVPAFAPAGAAPPSIESLTATPNQAGVVLQWKQTSSDGFAVDFTRTDLSSPAMPAKPKTSNAASMSKHHRPSSQAATLTVVDSQEVHLHVTPNGNQPPAGTVDITAVPGHTYRYVAQRVRLINLDGHSFELRSDPTQPVTLPLRDTFPPKPPSGLATIPGDSGTANGSLFIDLSWEPNSEADLAGYFVYRQLASANADPQGPLRKLTPSPVIGTAYRDVAVAPGQRYIYVVTAVDASGNESAPSAKAQEVATRQNGDPPQ